MPWKNNTGSPAFRVFFTVFVIMVIMIAIGIYLKG